MIRWSIEDENGCEGFFESKFFRNDENGGEFSIYGAGPELKECAEKCVEAFNSLPEPDDRRDLQKGFRRRARRGRGRKVLSFPRSTARAVFLNYCWFNAMYVDMAERRRNRLRGRRRRRLGRADRLLS